MPSDRPTLAICLACGGDYRIVVNEKSRYKTIICKWCTRGGMTQEQVRAWKNRKLDKK